MYTHVIERPLEHIHGVVRAKRGARLPVILSPEEVSVVLVEMTGIAWLISCLHYGSGLRLKESLRVRVRDLDFVHRAVVVRNGKGDKDQIYTQVISRGGMAVQSPLGATLRLNPRAVPEQTASTDTDTPKREPPDDD